MKQFLILTFTIPFSLQVSAQPVANPLCKTDFVQEVLNISGMSAEYFTLRDAMETARQKEIAVANATRAFMAPRQEEQSKILNAQSLRDLARAINEITQNSEVPRSLVYGNPALNQSPFSLEIDAQIVAIAHLIAEDQKISSVLMDRHFASLPDKDHNALFADQNAEFLGRRSGLNDQIGNLLRDLNSYIVNRGHCSFDFEIQERLKTKFQLPYSIFYPDAAMDEMEEMGGEMEMEIVPGTDLLPKFEPEIEQ